MSQPNPPIPQQHGLTPTPVPTSYTPAQKVVAGALAGALSTIVIFFLDNYILTGPKITGEVAAAITTVFTFLTSYMVPPSGLR